MLEGLFLYRDDQFKQMVESVLDYPKVQFMYSEKESINFNGEKYTLLDVSTNNNQTGYFADAISTYSGKFTKNRFTGILGNNPNLPIPIKELFSRHTKSAGGSETT